MSTLSATTSGVITPRLPQHVVVTPRPAPSLPVVTWGYPEARTVETLGKTSGPRGPALGRLALLQQQAELALEVRDLLEILVDAGEPHVGHLVELLELGQDLEPDVLARDVGALAAPLRLHLRRRG